MPMSNAEKCRNYRDRKREANKIKKGYANRIRKSSVKKSNAEYCRTYRLRRKMLAQGYQPSTNEVLCTPSTSNSQMTVVPSPLPVATEFNTDTTKTDNELKQFVENLSYEQVTIKIEDTLKETEIKKEINEELIIKEENSETNDDIFKCETCDLTVDTEIHLTGHTCWCKKNERSIETANQIQNDCASSNKSVIKTPMSNAEKCKNYRERKRVTNKIKYIKRTNAENCRMYRLRKKMLAQGYQPSTDEVLSFPSTSNSQMTFGSSTLPVIIDNIFECENCKLVFTAVEQLENHTFRCKTNYKPDGIDLNKEVLEIDNYKNYETVTIQQKKENIEQDALIIEDTLEKFEIKQEINAEITIKQEKYDTEEFNTDTTKTNNELKQFVENPGFEQVTIKIEDTLKKFEIKQEINEELLIKEEKSDTNDDIFKCETCELTFNTEIQLIDHTSWCKENERSIETSNQIQNDCASSHKNEVINSSQVTQSKEPYECNVCKKSFKSKSGLKHHKIIHTGDKPFACDVCNKKFNKKGSLQRHKYIHTGDKPFSCDVCKQLFTDKFILNHHKHIHTGEKPYECDVCKKSFRLKISLNHHMLIHTGERPFACDVCNKTYRHKSYLYRHKRIHDVEKPYECDVCKRSFRFKRNLSNHECSSS